MKPLLAAMRVASVLALAVAPRSDCGVEARLSVRF
jgi:hypothetical protein